MKLNIERRLNLYFCLLTLIPDSTTQPNTTSRKICMINFRPNASMITAPCSATPNQTLRDRLERERVLLEGKDIQSDRYVSQNLSSPVSAFCRRQMVKAVGLESALFSRTFHDMKHNKLKILTWRSLINEKNCTCCQIAVRKGIKHLAKCCYWKRINFGVITVTLLHQSTLWLIVFP